MIFLNGFTHLLESQNYRNRETEIDTCYLFIDSSADYNSWDFIRPKPEGRSSFQICQMMAGTLPLVLSSVAILKTLERAGKESEWLEHDSHPYGLPTSQTLALLAAPQCQPLGHHKYIDQRNKYKIF